MGFLGTSQLGDTHTHRLTSVASITAGQNRNSASQRSDYYEFINTHSFEELNIYKTVKLILKCSRTVYVSFTLTPNVLNKDKSNLLWFSVRPWNRCRMHFMRLKTFCGIVI